MLFVMSMQLFNGKYFWVTIISMLVTLNEAVAEPYYAANNARMPINTMSLNSERNARTREVRMRPDVMRQVAPQMAAPQAVAPAASYQATTVNTTIPFSASSAPIAAKPIISAPVIASIPSAEPVIIESTTPPVIINKSANSKPLISNQNAVAPAPYQPLNIALPDKSKAEYIPKNYKAVAPVPAVATVAASPQSSINPLPKIAPAAPANNANASGYGWNKYVPPEMRNVAPAPPFSGKLYVGYRQDNADWNVAGDIAGQNPSKLSELEFESVGMTEVGGEAEYTHRDGMAKGAHIEGAAYYAKAMSGETRDSDFREQQNEDGTIGDLEEFSRSTSSNDDSDAMGFKVAAGYEVRMDSSDNHTKGWITPIVGYAVQKTNYNMKNGVQVIPDTGAFEGLNSNYEMEWSGPFGGLKGGFKSGSHLLDFRGELHFADYEGTGEWNLRQSFNQPVSFINSGNGLGFELGGDYTYVFEDSGWGLFGGVKYRSFGMEDGIDTVIFSDGSTSSQKLNEVNWTSQLYRVGARYSF
jgi:hypothetical protein